jgi:APA family basic amino acid/polyamine antiporter
VLTYPRVFFAMAKDGLFPAGIARVNPRTHTPVAAIVLQCALTIVVICAGHFESILNYVESMDAFFLGLAATTLFAFRRRDAGTEREAGAARVPGHPWTTLGYVSVCWIVAANSLYKYRMNAALVLAILCAGVPFYAYWRSRHRQPDAAKMAYERSQS